ncbi:MAG: tetratricopeptide repeat protein [Chlamydiota bacterium]
MTLKDILKQITHDALQGRTAEAEEAIKQLLERYPRDPQVFHKAGLVAFGAKDFSRAAEYLKRALNLPGSNDKDIYYDLGITYARLGQHILAIEHYQQALDGSVQDYEVHYQVGQSFYFLEQYPAALGAYQNSLKINRWDAKNQSEIAKIFVIQKNFSQGVHHYQLAAKYASDQALKFLYLGHCQKLKGHTEEALKTYQKAAELAPENPSIIKARAKSLIDFKRYPEAVTVYCEAANNNPDHAAEYYLQTSLIYLQHCYSPSLCHQYLSKALEADPQYAFAHYTLGNLKLYLGHFREGWRKSLWRWKVPEYYSKELFCYYFPEKTLSWWQGEDLNGKKVLITQAEGMGDIVMFSSIIPDLKKCYPDAELHFRAHPRLFSLFRRSFPIKDTYNLPDNERLKNTFSSADYMIPLGNLANHFRNSAEDFPGKPFLKPDEKKTSTIRERYPKKFLVGLSWHTTESEERSIALEQLLPLLELDNISWVNLQYGDHSAELASFTAEYDLEIIQDSEVDPLGDMDTFAAQIAALDAVVTIDNTTAHLAGALGVPCYILLPSPCNWRWHAEGQRSLWYSSARLYRKEEQGCWQKPLQEVKDHLLANINPCGR